MNTGLLRKFSIIYLLLPNLLFCVGWFKIPFSILLPAGYIYLLWTELRKTDHANVLSIKELVSISAIAVVWTFFCGAGGMSTQSLDWLAHNSKFYDLYKNSWPNYFPEIDRSSCYYFGYYLVPSALSKLAGILLPSVIVVWTWLGFFLGLSWIYLLINKNIYLLLLLPFVRGVGQLIGLLLARLGFYHAQIPIINPSLRSIFQQTLFAPNQVIPALIISGILLYDGFIRKKVDDSFLLITLSFVWAIFPSIYLVLIFGSLLVHKYLVQNNFKEIFRLSFIRNYLLPGLLFVPVFIYFLSSAQTAEQGFLWNHASSTELIFGFASGILVDVIIFYILTRIAARNENLFPVWFINTLFCCILLMSVYYMGMFNDQFFRGSIPIFVMIITIIFRGTDSFIREKAWPASPIFYGAGLIVALLVVVEITIQSHLLRDNVITDHYLSGKTKFKKYPYDTCANMYQTIKITWGVKGADEYLAAKNSLFEQYLGKKPVK